MRLTSAITRPPLARAAWARVKGSRIAGSCSMLMFPNSSAVVPRMIATSMGTTVNESQSPPSTRTRSTMGVVVTPFRRPPPCPGSTKVSRPTWDRIRGFRLAAAQTIWQTTPCGKQ